MEQAQTSSSRTAGPAATPNGATAKGDGSSPEQRWTFGLAAVGIGVVALLVSLVAVAIAGSRIDGVAVLGVVASPIASIIGAYFGIQISGNAAAASHAQAVTAQQGKDDASADVAVLLAHLDAADFDRVKDQLRSI